MTRTAFAFTYEPAQCDVPPERQARLLEFRTRLAEWRSWFFTDQHHAIADQIYSMMWRDAVFRLVNETRREKPDTPLATFNGLLAEALNEGFVANQAIALRRLIDKASDVISLPRLIKDLDKHRKLITREMYVCHDGLPYDWESVRDADLAAIAAAPASGGAYWRMATVGPTAWDMSSRVHNTFDELARVTPQARSRDDVLHSAAVDLLADAVENSGARAIADRANKYLLHSADAASRARIPAVGFDFTLDELSEVHRKLLQAAECIALKILQSSIGDAIPTPQWNIVESLDRPFATAGRLDELQDFWHQHKDERDAWLHDPIELHPK